ncbi:PREDICTED: MATH domain and coiled-coil domain-containing protein At3g58360-like, partial [Camelina sativa]|uniref:MATH domain and coiled-coil domain-containing protein At3g58360-like n=1 Tax=Camelina sativa TaxID=90675 RepID=A0ABM1RL48_CAMSA
MGKPQLAKKITWAIKNFSSSETGKICSDPFVVGGCKWRLIVHPKGNNADYLFMYLEVADYESLSPGWRRHVCYLLNIVNQNAVKRSKQNEEEKWFDVRSPRWGRLSMFPLNEISARDSGFVVNGELKIVAEIEVLEVIGSLDVSEETSTIMETTDFNGFQLLPSQVGFVSHIFERHPEIASEMRLKNPNLRTGYMSLLLSLIETLRQSPNELHKTEIDEAFAALRSMTDAGFKVDWLAKKLVELSEKKQKEEAGGTRMQE